MSFINAEAFLDKFINGKYYSKALSDSQRLPEGFTLTYHAGALKTKPNTVESIEAALADGALVVEFDVSFRPDGTAVIIHADKPNENEGVLLDEALAAVAKDKNCRINLDIKSTANLPKVDALVKKHGLFERVFYTGVFRDWVETVKANSAIPYYLNHKVSAEEAASTSLLQKLAEEIISLGAIGLNSNFSNANSTVTEVMHKNGLLVSLWTVNSSKDAARVIGYLPDNITTKKPHLIKNMIVK